MDQYLKVAGGGRASPKRELRNNSKSRQQQKSMMSNLMEAITQANGGGSVNVSEVNENGVVRMKIMVRKQDFRQILEAMNNSNISQAPSSSSSAEQRRNHLLRAVHVNAGKESRRRRSWRPVLQSIPEEL
ncbi:VWFA domain-containing protein [Melia azedarach]|uniref:VWFA domain-containing protein n=1 Tax=Melia azedarach TaxID=155640 RepID=A0ACC1XYD1_MELAZ|nr:VWFA domain-containing protein [Melia azedarach]